MTFEVSKLDKSMDIALQPENIFSIVVTSEVSKDLKSKYLKFEFLNIPYILLTLDDQIY